MHSYNLHGLQKSRDLLMYPLPHPYHLHLWTLDFYLNLMDNSLQPLVDHPLDMMPSFSLKFHSHNNQHDYYDCEISEKNLASYPEDGPPVVVDYYPSSFSLK